MENRRAGPRSEKRGATIEIPKTNDRKVDQSVCVCVCTCGFEAT